jgi:hypothetical protein
MSRFRWRPWCVFAAGLVCASMAARAEPRRLVVGGDSRGSYNGVNAPILTELAAAIVSEQPDLLLFLGDLVTGSSNTNTLISQLTNWVSIMQPVYDAGIEVLAVRGNHENQGSVTAWNTVFTGAYAMPANGPAGEVNCTYSLQHREAFIAGLDVYFSHPHRVNQSWLDAQLAANHRPHIFVFAHEPAFKADHADCLGDYPTDRDVFWQSTVDAHGRTYFCGHDHFYDHARIDEGDGNPDNDVHQIIVATGGAPLYVFNGVYNGVNDGYTPLQQYYESNYGYVVIEIDGLQVTLQWKHRAAAGVYSAVETWSYLAHPRPYAGDLNCDGVVNGFDIDPFVLALSDPAAYQAAYPNCNILNADINCDGAVNAFDIDPFVQCLTVGCPPCP